MRLPRLLPLLDLLAPPRCAACDGAAWDGEPGEALCAACAAALEPPVRRCGRCARPAGPWTPGPGCPRCAGEAWALDGIVTGLAYRGTARALVVALKFGRRPDAAAPLARRLAEALQDARLPGDLLVPVPLAPARERARGYNQAALLAERLARATGVELARGALARRRADAPQSRLTPGRRRRGPRGAFAARPGTVEGRSVLLVDDVLTSGATALACARVLRAVGARSVVAAVACRSEGHPGPPAARPAGGATSEGPAPRAGGPSTAWAPAPSGRPPARRP